MLNSAGSRMSRKSLFCLSMKSLLNFVGIVAVVVAAVLGNNAVADSESGDKLKIQVYYETLCPDSMQFLSTLNYAMMNNNWLPHTDLKFVPYGKVSIWTDPKTNVTTLYCQHGKAECELNALHACIVEHHGIEEQMKMIHCLMRGYSTNIDNCATKLNIDVTAAKECKATRTTQDILHKYGVATDALDISFVPSIGLDGIFDRSEQPSLFYNFESMFCRRYKKKFNVTLEHCYIN